MSDQPRSGRPADDEDLFLEEVTRTLLGIASGSFEARTTRSYRGDSRDVLAFLANSTADEVAILVQKLEHEREELRRAQAQLVQAEKLAALGRLAANVAHELNQPLTVILSMAEMLRKAPEQDSAERNADLELISEAARQMSSIVDSVRSFGMGPRHQPTATQAVVPLESAHRLMSPELDKVDIAVRWQLPEDDVPILADVDRLRQVFVNLIANAKDALVAAGADAPTIGLQLAVEPEHVVYRVMDNGPGVDPAIESHLFEPFFSTKDAQQGTGLGLSVVHGIVQEHGGTIALTRLEGTGACFEIRLPRVQADG